MNKQTSNFEKSASRPSAGQKRKKCLMWKVPAMTRTLGKANQQFRSNLMGSETLTTHWQLLTGTEMVKFAIAVASNYIFFALLSHLKPKLR